MPMHVRVPGSIYTVNPDQGSVPQLPIRETIKADRVSPVGDSTPGLHETNRLYTPPTTQQQLVVVRNDAGGSDQQLGFTARSVQYSNYTTQWVWFETLRVWLPPGLILAQFQIPSGTQNGRIFFESPPNTPQPAQQNASDVVVLNFLEDFFMPSAGIALTAIVVP